MPTEPGPNKCDFLAPDGQKMSSSIFMIWNSLVTIPFELDTDLHSPHSNGNFERQDFGEGVEALSSSGPQKVVFWGPGLAGDPLENQENTKDCDCWPSSVELGRARPAVKILNIRARPASAELGRAQPRNWDFFAPDDQKMSSSIFMVWNSLVTVPFELESDLHSSRSNDTFEHRIFRNSRSPPGEDAAAQNGPPAFG